MTPATIGLIGILVMLVLFTTRMPVAFVMGVVGFVGFSVLTSVQGGLNMLSRAMYEVFVSYDLTTIPLFILMGQLAFNAGISRRLFSTAHHFFGHIRGGLAMATVTSCTAFGAVCGSSPATAATMATVAIPEMKRFGYGDRLAAGAVAAGGGLGMVMPPSVVLIVYGVLTEQSIGQLFVAGILPALLLTGLFLLAIMISCRRRPELGPPCAAHSWSARFKSLTGLIDTLVIFGLVMTGLSKGWFTPTEAASVGAFGVLVMGVVRRQLGVKLIMKSLEETLRTSCMILFLVAGAVVFGKFLAVTRIPFTTASFIGSLDIPAMAVLGLIVLIYFVGGCFMDSLAMVMLTVPVFFPVIVNLGFDPIWFGVIIVLITEMGVITPPVGINVYVVYGVTTSMKQNISLESIFRGIYPFLLATFAGVLILTLFPDIVTCLPYAM
ncbi:MAG: TRAP transporter large permease [Deltaproteobacteria bacterium]|nr:TRAP transporter large permease [Deltaproteobacteria bacterium]